MERETVGLIGVGLLGTALAEGLLRRGFGVLGYDIAVERLAHLENLGGRAAATAREAAACRRLLLSLPTSEIVDKVITEITPVLSAGQTVLDTTTGEPERTAALGAVLADRGVDYLDATVSGSSEQARAAAATLMVGGELAVFEANTDLFSCFAASWFHVGPWGAGARMKLVTNLVLGLNRAALAEGLAFARACGVDAGRALEVLQAGAAFSRVMETKGRKMVVEDFAPQARLAQHLKDVLLILAEGNRAGAALPLSTVHRELLERLVADGLGDLDNAAIVRAFGPATRTYL